MKIRKFAMMLSLSAVLGLIACGSDDANPASDGGVSGSTLVDSRDRQSYRIVTIGEQTWMAQNLNYATSNSVCYNDDPNFCTEYGRLYFAGEVSTACPSGWHVPKKEEWMKLLCFVSGEKSCPGGLSSGYLDEMGNEKFKSKEGWAQLVAPDRVIDCNGTDDYNFTVLPAGQYYSSTLGFWGMGGGAYFWGYGKSGDYEFHHIVTFPKMNISSGYGSSLVSIDFITPPVLSANSIRCVKD